MYAAPPELDSRVFTQLPPHLHLSGPPGEWARFERPGRQVHSFLEGPAFDRFGRLHCVDIAGGRIFRISADGSNWQMLAEYEGEPTGMAFHADGRIFIADNRRGILALPPEGGTPQPVVERVNLEPLRGCNDLAFAPSGDLYFTVPGQSSLADPTGRLYRLTNAGQTELLLANLAYPNGLVVDRRGSTLYLAETYTNSILKVPLSTGCLPPIGVGVFVRLSGGLGPDGLALDQDGNLALAQARQGTVWLFNDLGEPIWRIRSAAGNGVTNLAYGGPDNKSLFITEADSGSILVATLPVPGQSLFSHRNPG